jgi:flagellar basal-body rod modification protein FlgD
MSIVPLETVQSASNAAPLKKDTVLGKEDFLNLLIAQLQHQDPLNPMESTEFTAQLAQFSSLEQLSNVNTNLEALQSSQATLNNTQAVSFIGKSINVLGNSVRLENGQADDIHFELMGNASEVMAYIYDATGDFVTVLNGGAHSAGRYTLDWNGLDQEGNIVPDGEYRYELLATDLNGQPVEAATFMTATVSGVTFHHGSAHLIAGGYEIPISDVIEVIDRQ